MRRIVKYADKATARAQCLAVNVYYMRTVLPTLERKGDRTQLYVRLCRWSDGSWGFEVDSFVRSLHGRSVGSSPRITINLSSEQDMPTTTISIMGSPKIVETSVVDEVP